MRQRRSPSAGSFRFRYRSLPELRAACRREGIGLEFCEETDSLKAALQIGGQRVPNRLLIQPMEGYDSTTEGAPGELTVRRYRRYAAGGAGTIWFEATAVLPEGRSNPHQLLLADATAVAFETLLDSVRQSARERLGRAAVPFCVLQLTHSGRFSKPEGPRRPRIAVHDRLYDPVVGIDGGYPVLSDGELAQIRDAFVRAARLAFQVGFDGVDIKSCHRYLICELLGARTRPGRYGGCYENRTRFLKEVLQGVSEEAPGLLRAVRLNASDVNPAANGWGVAQEAARAAGTASRDPVDLREPLRLVGELAELGIALVSVSAGTPYLNAYVTRPATAQGQRQLQPEHPLAGVARLSQLAAAVQAAFPGIPVVGGGYSWLRQFGGNAAAWNVSRGRQALAGFGRQAFAYPEFARDLLEGRSLEARRCCITCRRCSQLMAWGRCTGCVVHDAELYGPIYHRPSRGR